MFDASYGAIVNKDTMNSDFSMITFNISIIWGIKKAKKRQSDIPSLQKVTIYQ